MLVDVAATHERSREPVRDACTRFPDGYRRELGVRREHPEDSVWTLAGSGHRLVLYRLAGHVVPRPS